MDSILETLEIAEPETLVHQFTSILSPFSDFIPLDPTPAANKNPKKKKRLQITPTSVRPLAKRFLPFLLKSLKLIPSLLRRNPSSQAQVDHERVTELLKIYRLVLDCLSCISPCLLGNPNFVDVERCSFAYYLETWGKYEEAEEEAYLLVGRLKIEKMESLEPEIVRAAAKLASCLIGCAYKSKSKDGAVYWRTLQLVEKVFPRLRGLDTESMGKYHTLLVSALSRCAVFLAGECISFDSGLVREFCCKTLTECLQYSTDRLQNISLSICRSIDRSWESRPVLIFDMLNINLNSLLCECKAGVTKAANEFFEFVGYCVKCFCSTSIDICRDASEVLYKYGGDFLQVSHTMASILFLYATGLYFKSLNEGANAASLILLFLDNEEKLRTLTESLAALVKYFDAFNSSNKVFFKPKVKESGSSFGALETSKYDAAKHLLGNVSMLSYLDALEFLCLLLVDHVNTAWVYFASQDRDMYHSDKISYLQEALHLFCDFILAAFKCTNTSERERERLQESRKTALQVAVSSLKISLGVSENHKKSLSTFKSIISSAWIEPQELTYFISALGNIGASLYNSGQLKQASVALQLRAKTIWAHIKLLCKVYTEKPKGSHDVSADDEIKTAIIDSFEKCAMIVDVLHKCHAANVHKIAVKSIVELSAGEDMFPNLSGSLALVKQWVKMLCKDFVNIDLVDEVPYLYSFLLSYHPSCSKKTLGKILEQELLVYESMESRNPILCQKMKLKVINTLLDNVLTTEEHNLQRSRILVWKGRTHRARGTEGLNDCISCIRDAISLLKEKSGISSQKMAPIYTQLALTYILAAQCSQEANQDCEVVLQDVRKALEIWFSIDVQAYFSENCHLEPPPANTIKLLCSVVDLLSMKGCWELQFGICKLIVMFFKCKVAQVGKCLAMLWNVRRISHSLCSSPINEDFIQDISEYLNGHTNSIEFWITCLKDSPSSLVAFFQKFLLSDSIQPEVSHYHAENYFANIAADDVEKVATSLISDTHLSSESAAIAGYLQYDLSERLFSRGKLFEALSHARVALSLRKKLLQMKFIYSFQQQFAKPVNSEDTSQNMKSTVCLEIIGSVATELWPHTSKSRSLENYILTPWSVLRCYLESILQVGTINESIGNGAEAEVLFLTGKTISSLQDLPIFQIAFTCLLGQLYSKNQCRDLAENELNSARNLLQEHDMIITCKHCKLAYDVFIDMQFGDLSRRFPEKGYPVEFSSNAIQLYQKSLDKLNNYELESSMNRFRKTKTVSNLLDKSKNEVLNARVRHSTLEEGRLPECSMCSSSNVHHAKHEDLENVEGKGSNQHKEVKRSSRIASKKKPDSNSELKPKARLSSRVSRKKSTSASDKVYNSDARPADGITGPDNLNLGNSQVKENMNSATDLGCNEECISNNRKCWRCLLIKVMLEGTMQNIIYLKRECHCRRLVLQLLFKIEKCKRSYCGKNKAHEAHEGIWQCISVMFHQNPTSHGNPDVDESCLIELTQGEGSKDIFPMERAALLYNMSWFFLKDCHSEFFRTKCCTLANIQMPDVVPWLMRAFILSRELPLLFQKVSKLLASVLLISTIDGPVSGPFSSESSLSTSHWAAYFHQASIGTYLPGQYLACLKDKASVKVPEDSCTIMLDRVIRASMFLSFAPESLEHFEEFVQEFWKKLPSVPVICISLLEGDYANLIGDTLLLPSYLPAWMLLSRLNAVGQPIAMLLPVDRILEESRVESVDEWQCPWGYSVVDNVAPVFRQLLKENFLSSKVSSMNADTKVDSIHWWSKRGNLNNCLNKFLKSMEDSWLGPWVCLLLGERSDSNSLAKLVPELINELKIHCKADTSDSLVSMILGGSKSLADIEACISQLILYKGYFGRGACCGEERLRVFSTAYPKEKESMPKSIYRLLQEMMRELAEPADREPVILVLDSDVQMLPWENLPTLRNQEIYRMPSVGSVSFTLERCSPYRKQNGGADFPLVNPSDTYYLLNPSGDLDSTQDEFEPWFRNQNWEGESGKVPTAEELALALRDHDLFIYFGHGSGTQYIPGKEIQSLDKCAATLLMGCSSGSLAYKGCYAPRGAPLFYLLAGSPAVIANLWEVTDKDIDRFGKAMLESWLEEPSAPLENCSRCNQLAKEFGCLEIDDGRKTCIPKTRRKALKNGKVQHSSEKGRCKVCGRKRIASFMSEAREACRLPFLIGAAPVCYGVPTVIMKTARS